MADRETAHPDLELLKAYGRGQLDGDRMTEVEAHVATCDSCCQEIQSASEDRFIRRLQAICNPPGPTVTSEDLGRNPGVGEEVTSPLGIQIPSSFVVSEISPPAPTLPGSSTSERPVPSEVPAALADHPRYRIVKWLGSGGMGAVYLAEHRLMERTVALKVIKRDLSENPGLVERFRREVRAAARLHHTHIVTAFDAEQAGPLHFLVMEFVEGTDLAKLVEGRGPLPAAEACESVRQAALGMQYAHEHGMVHRDIKPQNLMRTPQGQVKILDFGLALFASEVDPSGPVTGSGPVPGGGAVTGSGAVLGTADYIAPEQADDAHRADIRADIYSLGCTLYFLLAGHPPFPGGTLIEKLSAHSRRSPEPLDTIRTDLPHGLVPVLDRMMAKDPAHRYQTPAEVARALAPFAEGAAASPSSGGVVVDAGSPTWTATTDLLPSSARKPGASLSHRRDRPPRTMAVALLLLGVGLLGLIYRIATDKGDLIIQTEVSDVEVVVKQAGKAVTTFTPRTRRKLKLRSGDYEVALGDNAEGLQISTNAFTLSRDEQEIVYIWRDRRPETPPSAPSPGDEILRFGEPGEENDIVDDVAFSPDGRRALSSGKDRSILLWDAETGRELRRLEGHSDKVASVTFSPDGRRALSGSFDRTIRLWDVETGQELRRFEGDMDRVLSVTFSPDGRRALSSGFDRTIRLWDVETGQELRRFEGHKAGIPGVAISPDGRRALSGSWDKSLRLWDVETGQELRRFTGPLQSIYKVAFSPDGFSFASCGEDKVVHLFDVDRGLIRLLTGPAKETGDVAFSPDGRRVLCGSYDGILWLWDAGSGRELLRVPVGAGILSVAFAPDGRRALSGSWDKTIRLWRLLDPPPADSVGEVRRFRGHSGAVMGVAFTPDGRFGLSCSFDRTVRLWDLRAGEEVRRFEGHRNLICGLACSPDGRRVLSSSHDCTIRLWDRETGDELGRLDATWATDAIAFSPDGRRILSGDYGPMMRLWDLETRQELRRFEGHTSNVRSVAFSPDGRRAASVSGHDVRLWDVEGGGELRRLKGHTGLVVCLAYSPDGRWILSTGLDKTIRLWDTETGAEERRFAGHESDVRVVAFSPDGRRALSGGDDRTMRLWDVETGREVRRFEAGTGSLSGVAFSPDGRYALSGGFEDPIVRLWRLPEPAATESISPGKSPE